jgi:MscS family membrane protein
MSNSSRSSLARLLEARSGRLALLALVLCGAWLTATPVLARSLAARSQDVEQAQAGEARFASPREIGRVLYAVQQGGRPERAAQVFELGHLSPAKRRSEGALLVETRLSPILDRLVVLAPDGAPFEGEATLEGEPTWVWKESPPGRKDLEVRLGFVRMPDGGWRIDRDTVENLESAYAAVRDLPRLEGLEGKPVSLRELLRQWVPHGLKRGGFVLRGYQWIGLFVLVLLGIVIERVVLFALRPLLRRVTKGEGSIYDELLGDFERPVGWVLGTGVFLACLPVLDIEPRYRETLELSASVVLAVGGVWAAYRLVDVASWHLERRARLTANRFDDMLVPLLRRTLKVLVLIVGVVFVTSQLTTDLWGIFAGLSIGSLALGFAAKDSIENLFGTFTVLLDNPFKLGDLVKVGGYNGTIEQVGFRSTRLRTDQDTLVTMPNSRFIASDIENLSQRRRRRVGFVLGATYDTPPHTLEAFCEGLRELVRRHPWTYKHDFQAWFESFGPVSLDVRLVCFLECLDAATFQRERHRLNLDILRLAGELEVSFAFPTQTIHMAPEAPAARKRTPADLARAVAEGRRAGESLGRLALEPFGDERPGPVRFDPDVPDAQGPLPPRS